MKLVVNYDCELLDYLYSNLDIPKKRVKSYLTHKCVYINNCIVTQYNYKLIKGMTVIIDTNNKAKLPFDILFEDNDIIVVNKPSGLLSIATRKEKDKTLYHLVGEYLRSKDKRAKVYIVHRLDKDTSGIVVLAKNERIKKQLQDNWNEYVSLREYTAVIHGSLKNKKSRIVQELAETKTNLVYVTKKGNGKEAITDYEVLKENGKYSLLKVNIITGRKNQIRVAFSSFNTPVVGDVKYGIKDSSNRLYLHANRLKIYYPVIGKDILFEVNIPNEFKKIMRG